MHMIQYHSLVSISMLEHPGDSCPYWLTSRVVNRLEADFRLIHDCAAAVQSVCEEARPTLHVLLHVCLLLP